MFNKGIIGQSYSLKLEMLRSCNKQQKGLGRIFRVVLELGPDVEEKLELLGPF